MCSSNASSLFSVLVVVVTLQMLMGQTSAESLDVTVIPTHIAVGLSASLDVICTFSMNTSSTMAEITSLTVSRGTNSQLATITTSSDHQVNVTSSEEIKADGVINQGGQSYIHLQWDYPTDTLEGTYQCVARGLDLSGQDIETVNISVVSAGQPEIQDFVHKVVHFRQMSADINRLGDRVSSIESSPGMYLSSVFLPSPLTYENKQYYVSKDGFQDFNETIFICKAFGGKLVEINNIQEYEAIREYLGPIPDLSHVYIGGTDEINDGEWVLPSDNSPMTVTFWYSTSNPDEMEPSRGETRNCVYMDRSSDWMMYSTWCHLYVVEFPIKYMCEIPSA